MNNKKIEIYKVPNTENIAQISYGRDGTYRTEYLGKNIMALDMGSIKSAINLATMHRVTSNWVPMILVKRNMQDLFLDVKFIGIITETNLEDRYVISDIIKESSDVNTWKPSMDYRAWSNDGSYRLIPYNDVRYQALQSLDIVMTSMREKIHDIIFSEDAINFIDNYSTDKNVLLDVLSESDSS